jgi:Icc-related predicted phosphoesterase
MKKLIKILCVSDEIDLLVYSQSVRERFGDVDIVLSAGDLPDEYLEFISGMLNRPLLSVAGNHDDDDSSSRRRTASLIYPAEQTITCKQAFGRLSFKIRKESGIAILGIPGSMRYNNGPNQYSEAAMRTRLLWLIPILLARRLFLGRAVDVILAHSPPKGIHDAADLCHNGFSSFNWLIKIAKPRYFLHGHVHLYDLQALREQVIGDTTVINVYGHKIVTIEKEINGE